MSSGVISTAEAGTGPRERAHRRASLRDFARLATRSSAPPRSAARYLMIAGQVVAVALALPAAIVLDGLLPW